MAFFHTLFMNPAVVSAEARLERQQVQPGEAFVDRRRDKVLRMQGGERRNAGAAKGELSPFAAQLMDRFAAEEEAGGEVAE